MTEICISLRLEYLLHAVQMKDERIRFRNIYRSAAGFYSKAVVKLYRTNIGNDWNCRRILADGERSWPALRSLSLRASSRVQSPSLLLSAQQRPSGD